MKWSTAFLLVSTVFGIAKGQDLPYTVAKTEVGDALREANGTASITPMEFGYGHYLEGDIMVPPSAYHQSNGLLLSDTNRWPNGSVPYVITGNFSTTDLQTIQNAMKNYSDTTCIRFVPRTTETVYLTIKNNETGCWSYVGRNPSNTYNVINLQTPGCVGSNAGTPVHEMMHALGFYHEFNRPDRDSYVFINRSALQTAYQADSWFNVNFAIYAYNTTLLYNTTYNYGSVMHYSKWGGAVSYTYPVMNNLLPWTGDFGSTYGLAAQDIILVNNMYCPSMLPIANSTVAPTPTTAAPNTTTTGTPKIPINPVTDWSSLRTALKAIFDWLRKFLGY